MAFIVELSPYRSLSMQGLVIFTTYSDKLSIQQLGGFRQPVVQMPFW